MAYALLGFVALLFGLALSGTQQRVKRLESRLATLERRLDEETPPTPRYDGATPHTTSPRDTVPTPLSHAQLAEIDAQLRQDRLIMAIKLYREYTGVGLKEAKEAVEKLRDTR
ncbi:hypothetical protein AB0M28_30060 [Streptomyces sp. NPDC051940]|uniref:hypothetical protein n=1 Tax=Streptomyces sp. NPDC051940 TaxID=3155675 RepID=UPI0034145BA0